MIFISATTSALTMVDDLGFGKTETLSLILQELKAIRAAKEYTATVIQSKDNILNLLKENSGQPPSDPALLGHNTGPLYSIETCFLTHQASFQGAEVAEGETPSTVYLVSSEAAERQLYNILEYSLLELDPSFGSDITTSLLNNLWNEFVAELEDVSMMSISQPGNFWPYSYLLFPPIQDGRIAKCI